MLVLILFGANFKWFVLEVLEISVDSGMGEMSGMVFQIKNGASI